MGVVTEYGKAKALTGDGTVHRDHQPSKAALLGRAEQLKGEELTKSEIKRITNGALSVNVPAEIHRAGPTYGGKNTKALQLSDAADLAKAAARDANTMVDNSEEFTPEHTQTLRESGEVIKQRTNEHYDEWLVEQFDKLRTGF